MAGKRNIDTSAMFRSMTGHAGTESSAAPQNTAREDAQDRRLTPAAATDRRAERDKQSVKLSYYLTPRVCEAIQLHKSTHFIGAHNDSKLVNAALCEYFKKELSVLDALDPDLPPELRLQEATKIIFSSPDVTN